ncbi:hypothetical protein [Aeromonas caviae]|uniref:hypothetical protein n=1 Tax=Aeromonas caviae TaxID=648 RepID=UPI001432E6F0|nr:hypothetical protein [Aeromonas caviae]NKD17339.1 hypothetical protein [Aeromonas caviae]
MMPLPILSAAIMTFLVSFSATAGTLQCKATVGSGANITVKRELNPPTTNATARFDDISICTNVRDLKVRSGGVITVINNKNTVTRSVAPMDSITENSACPHDYRYRIGHAAHLANGEWSYINQTTYIHADMLLYSSDTNVTGNADIQLTMHWRIGTGYVPVSPRLVVSRPTTSISRTITFDESQTIALDAGTTVSYPISGKISSDSGMPLADVFYKIRPAEADGLHVKFNNGANDITTRWTFPTLLVTADRNTGTGSYRRVIDATVTCP